MSELSSKIRISWRNEAVVSYSKPRSLPSCFKNCCVTPKFDLSYPFAFRDESVYDDYFGIRVKDPYRWLEDPDSSETQDFIESQNALTTKCLEQCPHRNYIRRRLTELYSYSKYSCPFRRGAYYFFFKNAGAHSQMVLYRQDDLHSKPKVFLDLNISSNQGQYSIHSYAFSKDGEIFSYLLSSFGSDWCTIHFQNCITGEKFPDVLKHVKYSNLAWTHDNRGVFYSRYPEPEVVTYPGAAGTETVQYDHQKLYYHRLGYPQSEDVLAAEFPDHPQWAIRGLVSHCGNYLLLFPWQNTGYNMLYIAHLTPYLRKSSGGISQSLKLAFIPIYTEFDSMFESITNVDSSFIILTTHKAPRSRIISIDIKEESPGDSSTWKTLIGEHDKYPIDWALRIANDKIMVCYIEDVKHSLKLFQLEDGVLIKHFVLEEGSITCHSGKRMDMDFFYRIESILNPTTIYRIDLASDKLETTIYRKTKHKKFDPHKFEVKQVWFPSKDGTEIPMFISHKKGLKLNGDNFCRLTAYGGFGLSTLQSFFPPRIFLMDNLNGIYALCNIRGGGEFGETWHLEGSGLKQQNSFDDFQAAAEYLINNKYTKPSKLAINGSSNGGLLMAVSFNQRPDLFGAAVSVVGVYDLIRFHEFTVGHCWVSEYGSTKDEKEFKNLIKISPYHNVREPEDPGVAYPSLLISTADHDDRVVPLHSLKFVAQLQHTLGELPQQKDRPILLKVYSKTGHGKGKSDGTLVKEHTDIYSFLIVTLGLKVYK